MAETPIDPTQIQAAGQAADVTSSQFVSMGNSVAHASDLMQGLGTISSGASDMLKRLDNTLSDIGIKLNSLSSLTEQQTQQMGMLSVAVLGVRDSYQNLMGVDMTNLSTFSSQLDDLVTILGKDSAAFGALGSATKVVADALAKAGRPIEEIENYVKKGATAFINYAKGVLQSADNANKLQNAYIQLSAQTGNLGEVMRAAGPELDGLNYLLAQQAEMMGNAEQATGLGSAEVEKYWSELGKIPGALQQVVHAHGETGRSTSGLVAAIEVARGTGRKYEDVMQDVTQAFRDYGTTLEQGLTITARMTDVANKLGVPFEDVRKSIMGAANDFKLFVNAGSDAARQSQDIAHIMADYSSALQAVGVSATNSIGMVQQMLGGVKDLRIEQKAFLSQQTGGPGGLMGGFQIEKLMREGKTEEVMDKVMQSMKRQFGGGKIVNFDEASQSQAGAMQYERQIRMLQQGPLGGMAKDRESAERLLDAMRKRSEGGGAAPKLEEGILGKTIDTGTKLQQTANTELSRIRSDISAIRRNSDVANYGTVQSAFASRVGFRGQVGGAQEQQRNTLRQATDTASVAGGDLVKEYNRDIKGHSARADHMMTAGLNAGKDLFQTITKDLPTAVSSTIETLRQMIASGANPKEIESQRTRLLADIAARKSALNSTQNKMTQQQRNEAMKAIDAEQTAVNIAGQRLSNIGTNNQTNTPSIPQIPGVRTAARGQNVTAGGQVRNAVRANANAPNPQGAPTGQPGHVPGNQNLNVHVTGTFDVKLPDGSTQRITPQMRVSNPAAGQ